MQNLPSAALSDPPEGTLRRPLRTLAMRYGVAVVFVLIAFAVTLLVPWLRQRESFILFFAAIVLSARIGGYGPALVSCALTAFLHDYFIFYPPWEFSFGLAEVVPLLVFLAVAVIISSMTNSLARAEEQGREQRQRLRSMASEVSLAEERERRAIANGLHDRIGQSLALARIKLGSLRARLSQPELAAEMDDVSQVLKQIVGEVRSLTFELSPPILYEFGLDAALEWLTDSVSKQHGLACTFQSRGESKPLPQETCVLLFQSARELLTNVVKHARAKKAAVSVVKEENRVTVSVEDDGAGFEPANAMLVSEKTKCFGLFSMRERISHLGGTFAVDSAAGHGTKVTLSLPIATA